GLAIPVHRRGCARLHRSAPPRVVEAGEGGTAPRRLYHSGGVSHQAKLDDPRRLGSVSRVFSEGAVASEQEQFVPGAAHPFLRRRRGSRCRRAPRLGHSELAGSETVGTLRPTIAGDLLPRHLAVGAWAFRAFGIRVGGRYSATR